jgi:predicted porin
MVAFMPTENFTVKGFYSVDGDTTMVNTWAAYSVDSLTLAAEYNTSEDTAGVGSDADGYLLMANYGFESGLALTVRYHAFEVEDSVGTKLEDASAITISPSYAINDNLLIVTEYRMNSDEIFGDSDMLAIEALVTF